MARAIGTGTISFGLVSIPVKLFSSNKSSSGIRFNLLDKETGSRLKQKYFRATDGEPVERDAMVKGYEFAKGQYVTFTDEELKAVSEESTKAIEITEFVPVELVDPIFYDKAYYLGPDKGGDRAYALLAEAMIKTGRVGLAKYAARGKQYLVMLRPANGGLVMQQLHYAEEIRSMEELDLAEIELKDAELNLAVQFIEQIASEGFTPEQYHDEVKERLQAAIQQKVDGEDVTLGPTEAPKAQIIDLMEALKASLAETRPDEQPKAKRAKASTSKTKSKASTKSKKAGSKKPDKAAEG